MDPIQNQGTAQLSSIPSELLAGGTGRNLKPQVARSHYNEPISVSDGLVHGRSRAWGDISQSGQIEAIREIINQSAAAGLNGKQTAFVLSVARLESGFNPDAASTVSSAAGLGQFIDKTASSFGLSCSTRFNLSENVRAMVDYLKQSLTAAQKRFQSADSDAALSYAYALYHDGPSLKYGGLQIAQNKVLPLCKKFGDWLMPQVKNTTS